VATERWPAKLILASSILAFMLGGLRTPRPAGALTEYVTPRIPWLADVEQIGDCPGPVSPGEALRLRSTVPYGANRSHRITWGIRPATRFDAPFVVRTTHSRTVPAGEGRVTAPDRITVRSAPVGRASMSLVTYARIEARIARASRQSLTLPLGSTLAVRALDETGAPIGASLSVTSAGCRRTPGATWSNAAGRWSVFYHLDPAQDAAVAGVASGYPGAARTLSAALGELRPGTVQYLTLVFRRTTTSAQEVRVGGTSEPEVAITFDAGSDVGYTEMILDTLARNGVKAAFSLTGEWATAHPRLARRMAAEGHVIMNHSWDHPSFTGYSTNTAPLTQLERWSQLDRLESEIVRLTGHSTLPYFRPPFGDTDSSVAADVVARGYRFVMLWTIDSGGWSGSSVQEIIDRCVAGARNGAIVIMHVGSASQDGPALQGVIDALRARGWRLAPVDEVVD
jgi:peptidoglycan/xylan/chitin deacetylase (PgdA/CDA1 family)